MSFGHSKFKRCASKLDKMSKKQKIKNECNQIIALLMNNASTSEIEKSAENCAIKNIQSESSTNEVASSLENDEMLSSNQPSTYTFPMFSRSSDEVEQLKNDLAKWAVQFNICNDATNALLKIFSNKYENLPKDARTLKCTPKDIPKEAMDRGEYVHYGVKDGLTDFLNNNEHNVDSINLNINFDDLPLAKSSNSQIWPILVHINETKHVFLAGAYCGPSKPTNVNLYLDKFVQDLLELIDSGIQFGNKHFSVKCRAFICDAQRVIMAIQVALSVSRSVNSNIIK